MSLFKSTAPLILIIALTGCGKASISSTGNFAPVKGISTEPCPNVAQPIVASLATFTISDHLSQSYGYDLLPAIQLSPTASLSTVTRAELTTAVNNMNGFINKYLHYTSKTPGGNITQTSNDKTVTNELDLMNSLITKGSLSNINTGRSAIRTIVDKNQICHYENNSISITDTSNSTTRYYTVRYNYSPKFIDNNGNKQPESLTKVIASSITTILPGATSSTQQFTAYSFAQLNPQTFSSTAYNKPLLVFATYGDNNESMKLMDNFQKKTGYMEYLNIVPFKINSAYNNVKRVRFNVDYALSQVKVYISSYLVAYKNPDGSLLKDPTTTQLAALTNALAKLSPPETPVQVYDKGFDTINNKAPTSVYTYAGTSIPSRQ